MQKQIFELLKKYYIHFDENKYAKLLSSKTNDQTYIIFQKLWNDEHGGLYKINEPFHPPEILPYCNDKKIMITDTGSNSKTFEKLYIKTLNNIILSNKTRTLDLNFNNNFGGKPQIMIAGLLPIFNNFNITVLSYYYDKNNNKHYDVKKIENKIICISNNNAESNGTRKKCKITTLNIYYNNFTTSAAEQAIICLLSLSKYININLIGKKSAGYTTVNKYIKLSEAYGIEIPIGYMGTSKKIFYNGI